MIDVNWNLAPEGAVAVGQRKGELAFTDDDDHVFLNGHWGISMGWETVATRPTQTKTAADAPPYPHFKATRENLANIAKDFQYFDDAEQEGEKWTHIDAFGDPCRILIEEKDNLGCVVILRQSGHYATPAASSLKPIKPTLTKAQAWDKAVLSGNMSHITDNYDII